MEQLERMAMEEGYRAGVADMKKQLDVSVMSNDFDYRYQNPPVVDVPDMPSMIIGGHHRVGGPTPVVMERGSFSRHHHSQRVVKDQNRGYRNASAEAEQREEIQEMSFENWLDQEEASK
jgi:hypothetical protein